MITLNINRECAGLLLKRNQIVLSLSSTLNSQILAMAPRTRGNRGRRGTRISVGVALLPSPPTRPIIAQTSLALLPYKEPSSCHTASHSSSPRITKRVEVPYDEEIPESLSTDHIIPQSPPVAVNTSPVSTSPGTSSPRSKRQKASPSTKQVYVPKTLSGNDLLELVHVPHIVQERSFFIDELGGLFRQAVERQGWEEMLARMASARLNLTLVREFYANLAAALGPSRKAESLESKLVSIRGKKIMFNPSNIRYALNLPAATKVDKERIDSELKLITKEQVVECCYMHPSSKIPIELSCGQLHVSHRALGHLIRALLYPTTQTSQLPLAEAKLLCYLATMNKKVPAEFFLFETIKKIAISIARGKVGPKTSLFHPAVMTIVCHQQGIETYDGDEFGEPIKLSMSSVIRGNAQSINPGPNLDVEAVLCLVKKNAAAFEDKIDRRLSAIEDAVNGLQRMVSCLHDAFVAAKIILPGAETSADKDEA